MMNSPNATGQTAIRVLGGDVVGSLQHTPSMDSMRAPALTSPMNFSATSSVSQPPRWMPKERRRRDQRGDHASAERLDEAFEWPLPSSAHSPPSLILDRRRDDTTRCEVACVEF